MLKSSPICKHPDFYRDQTPTPVLSLLKEAFAQSKALSNSLQNPRTKTDTI